MATGIALWPVRITSGPEQWPPVQMLRRVLNPLPGNIPGLLTQDSSGNSASVADHHMDLSYMCEAMRRGAERHRGPFCGCPCLALIPG
ncbi:hypothetical protein [Streptosporangium canum]|uniref:hypothetical protein n=1 Tax=Streptosporangium canum TaxID=324952 RepID=UPI00378FFF80